MGGYFIWADQHKMKPDDKPRYPVAESKNNTTTAKSQAYVSETTLRLLESRLLFLATGTL
jgi:hypothetical protein